MGKRSDFERRDNDFYPTPLEAVPPLIPYLRGIRTFAEPCAGEGDLIRHLESFGLRCVDSGDISTGQDALARDHYDADAIITNPPYKRAVGRKLVRHFTTLSTPAWLLLRQGVASTIWMSPLLRHCSDIVAVPRLKLIKGTKSSGTEDHAWYRFDSRHSCGPAFHNNRGRGEVIPSRRTRICEQCRKAYQLQRSSARFCSGTCRQQAYRERLSVTVSVTTEPASGTAIEQKDSGELFRYVRHADVAQFESEGWERLPALDGTHHGHYSVLMRRVEQG
jgi:hypothetical protein